MSLDVPHPAEVEAPRPGAADWATLVILAAVALLVGADALGDALAGADVAHIATEALAAALAAGGVIVLLRRLAVARRTAEEMAGDLATARADALRWREEAREALGGLGAAIDRQFGHWGLTPAEREVALLILKGLGHKQIARERATAERTVRQQALAVYRKADVAGRAELAAFFLRDLTLPRARDERAG